MMLSDGHMEDRGAGARLSLHFGAKNRNYLLYIHAILCSNGYCSSKLPTIKPMKRDKKGNVYYGIKLNTYTFGSFTYFRKEWYNADRVKVMPSRILSMLNARVLRHMVMGDGSRRGNAIYIATYNFTLPEVELFVWALNKKFYD
jgi:hypothetical protein